MVRIRNNSTLSPLLFCSHAPPHDLQPCLCKLNQSPCDVMGPSLFESSAYKLEAEDWLYGNESLGHSIGAVESVAWPMDTHDNGFRRCQRKNGKGRQCKKQAKKEGDYHKLESRKNVNNCMYTGGENNNSNITSNDTSTCAEKVVVPARVVAEASRHVRPRTVEKKGAAEALKNPYELYYYSGFGPRWGRRRGNRKDKVETKVAAAATGNVGTTPATSCITTHNSNPKSPLSHKMDDQLDYIEDDFDDDYDDVGGECGRKRMRKHVKARSLK